MDKPKTRDGLMIPVILCAMSLFFGVMVMVNADRLDCPSLQGYEVTELWWSLRTEQDPSIMALFMPYRIFNGVHVINGVEVGFVSIAPSIRDNPNYSYDLVFSGWHIGDDGHPHPSCGVWLIEKSVLDNLRNK